MSSWGFALPPEVEKNDHWEIPLSAPEMGRSDNFETEGHTNEKPVEHVVEQSFDSRPLTQHRSSRNRGNEEDIDSGKVEQSTWATDGDIYASSLVNKAVGGKVESNASDDEEYYAEESFEKFDSHAPDSSEKKEDVRVELNRSLLSATKEKSPVLKRTPVSATRPLPPRPPFKAGTKVLVLESPTRDQSPLRPNTSHSARKKPSTQISERPTTTHGTSLQKEKVVEVEAVVTPATHIRPSKRRHRSPTSRLGNQTKETNVVVVFEGWNELNGTGRSGKLETRPLTSSAATRENDKSVAEITTSFRFL